MASSLRSTSFIGLLPALTMKSGVAGAVGLLAVASGFQSLADPVGFSPNFGIRLNRESNGAAPFVSLLGSRNFAVGLSILAFVLQGQLREAGVVLLACSGTGVLDAWTLSRYRYPIALAIGHIAMDVGLGAWLYLGAE